MENEDIVVKFWGVRGSIPTPGLDTARYGGNTFCVSVEGWNAVDGRERIDIFDAGTGIRALGQSLLDRDVEIILRLSHTHWDHIQGFPFFAPIYQPKRSIFFARSESKEEQEPFQTLLAQLDGTRFPLMHEQLRAQLDVYTSEQIRQYAAAGYQVARVQMNHPGAAYGFRADLRGRSIVIIPDNEINPPDPPPYPPHMSASELVEFCRGADVLIHDAQYMDADMPQKRGWGHSRIGDVWELGRAANVRHLVLTHHDPDRTDAELDAIQEASNRYFAEHAPQTHCTVAYEGLELRLPACTKIAGESAPAFQNHKNPRC